MTRWTGRLLLFVLLLSFVFPVSVPRANAAAETRLVVFEGFYRTL